MKLILHVALLTAVFCYVANSAPPPPTVDEMLTYLGFDADAKRDLAAGKVISRGFKESTDKELAVTVAKRSVLPLNEVFKLAREDKTFEVDREVIDFKDLGANPAGEEDFAGVQFTPEELGEVRELLRAEPGPRVNLDKPEIAAFQALRKRFSARDAERDPACAEAVTAEYRRILRERCRAYQQKGLDGVAPYVRGGDQMARPADELRLAARAATLMAERFPDFYRVFINYPRDDSKAFEHRFYWIKQRVNKRPAFILAHRIFYPRADGGLITERQFFVGHSYNSLQIIVGCLPANEGTFLFYTNRTSTDQVAGFSSGVKHTLGRNMMREDIVQWFHDMETLSHRK